MNKQDSTVTVSKDSLKKMQDTIDALQAQIVSKNNLVKDIPEKTSYRKITRPETRVDGTKYVIEFDLKGIHGEPYNSNGKQGLSLVDTGYNPLVLQVLNDKEILTLQLKVNKRKPYSISGTDPLIK